MLLVKIARSQAGEKKPLRKQHHTRTLREGKETNSNPHRFEEGLQDLFN
jgi:hypothetical protein